jgi:hypothetical protein
MRALPVLLALAAAGFAADHGSATASRLTLVPLEIAEGSVDLMLSGELPEHWAVTAVAGKGTRAGISAGAVEMDGPMAAGVRDVERSRLDLKPGSVRIAADPKEPGLAVCVTVPAGTRVRLLHDDLLVASSSAGMVVRDGGVIAKGPMVCVSLPAPQQVFANR